MKKILFAALTVAALSCCGEQTSKVPFAANVDEYQAFMDDIMTKYKAEGANRDSLEKVAEQYVEASAKQHIGDSLGLMLTIDMAYEMNRSQLDSAMNLCDLYKNNARLTRLSKALDAKEVTSAGCQYIDFEGVNALTGEPMCLSDVVNQGKPVVVDFWASWCGPCRMEIKDALSVYAPKYEGKVNFVGVAVWENSIEDTKGAIEKLPISWPILFAGGRQDSPTEKYGIMSIPQIMLLGPDGKILARDLRGEGIETAILKALE